MQQIFCNQNQERSFEGQSSQEVSPLWVKGQSSPEGQVMFQSLLAKIVKKDGFKPVYLCWFLGHEMTWTFGKLENHGFLPSELLRSGQMRPRCVKGWWREWKTKTYENLWVSWRKGVAFGEKVGGVKGMIKLSWNNIFFIFSHQDVSIE